MEVAFTGSHGTHRPYSVSFGLDQIGIVREVFCHADKSGSDLQGMIHDACIAISYALQHGARIADLSRSMGELREEGASNGPPASPLGAITRAGADLELELIGGSA